ncbi:MAG: asparagine synthase (glutamine-hydrolyzing) [Verrucomicrobiales bacterium]|nr:asparagine synthase (glutamine-hydrolyzing) [Verrucomicrobiales bacterium]
MCGIAGFLTSRPLTPAASGVLDRMLTTLHHRGPDGRGRFLEAAHGVALGHTRLSINDLAGGDQPLKTRDGELVLTTNGEFYDFKQYRASLMAEGDRFATRSDSEIALGLYRKHGLDFVHHLRGEFAFALYDRPRRRLLLVRDRFGIRPLFYHLRPDRLVYGSEVKALLAHPGVPRRLCPRAALNQLMQTMVPGSSAFAGIHALEPGQFLIAEPDGDSRLKVQTHRYWDLAFPPATAYATEPDAAAGIERVREALIRAIVLRLEADVPVGCYLSGGIDSCCILGLATGAMQSPVKAFTIAFDHQDYDESAIAREMARSMGADQELIRLRADDLYGENFIRTVRHAERTFYNTLGVAKLLMSRRVHECGYKTVITGEGSDELFAGYPAFRRDMYLHGLAHEPEGRRQEYQRQLEASNRVFQGAILADRPHTHPAWESLCGFTPSWIQPWIATLELARPLLHADVRDTLRDYDPVAAIAERIDGRRIAGRHPLDIAQYTWSKTQLEGQILNWGGDRVDMANSMESRPAFLDHHVAELACTIPPSLRIKNGVEKWVLREAVRGVLPETLYRREKFAFMAPPAHTDAAKRTQVSALIDRFLNPEAIEAAGLLDSGRIDRFLRDYRQDPDPVSLVRKDALLNHLLGLQILHEEFIRRPAPSAD